ncbi:acetate/propionate family kinase [Limnochorda pilosa]|uniref:Acetate kinase n=1 Tax=Limnochorda pilosa TaxID=1555112 RepID=A0A0K2SPM8_LIMPI|nr:acetate kinase [Limnochorda pilosa]BAS28957.1 acetate kinase [Limnochorda pilosa]
MKVFVLNSGSSSVKYKLYEMPDEAVLASGQVERIGMDDAAVTHRVPGREPYRVQEEILDHTTAIQRVLGLLTEAHDGAAVLQRIDEIDAVGHRVVHGGEAFHGSVRVTPAVKRSIRELSELAPLHNPHNLAGIEAAEELLPGVPQVAVFDTAFHARMPRHAFLYALPHVLYRRYAVRRYGFHGSSHRYVAERVRTLLGDGGTARIITCHLGNGASIAAVQGDHSIDTSMGFTPLEGLMMGTRSGDVDAGALLYVMARENLSLAEADAMLNKHSGVLGISGLASDMREIEEAADAGNETARLALEMYAYRIRKYIGAYAAALNGVDAIAFTAGIGEHSWRVREDVGASLGYLGAELDPEANRAARGEALISTPHSRVRLYVVPTDEEVVIARDTVAVVTADREPVAARRPGARRG